VHADATGEPDDRTLLRRHVDGDPDAFGALVRRHRDRLWAVALRTTGDHEEAQDALQDALVSALRAAHGYRGDAAVTTWLHRVVVNACLDRARRRAARPTSPLPDPESGPAVTHDAVAAREQALDLEAALATLPPEQRAAIVLVDVHGYPVDDVARMLEVAPGTVKSRCARGRARLLPLVAHLRPGNRRGAGDVPSPGESVTPEGGERSR
jgi:RNA polymerase sigma-70 factor, ECF subfamily